MVNSRNHRYVLRLLDGYVLMATLEIKMKKFKYCFLIAIFMVATASPSEKINVGILDFPPLYRVDNGKIVGGDMLPVIDRLMRAAGYEYNIKGYPAKRLFRLLKEGEVDVWFGLLHVPEYEGMVYSSQSMINTVHLKLFASPNEILFRDQGLEQLIGKSVIVIRGYGYDGELDILNQKGEVFYIKANDHDQALRLLTSNRAGFLLDYEESVLDASKKYGASINLQSVDVKSISMHILVSKKLHNGADVMRNLEDALKKIN